MSTYYLGMKIGSTNTSIYKSGNGLVLREPSLIAMASNLKIKDVKAIGNDAKQLIGKTNDSISVFSPISQGAVQYQDLAVLMLKGFLKKIFPTRTFGNNIKVVLSVSLGLSPAEKKQLEVTCFKAGIADVYIVPDVISYCYGSGIDIQSDETRLIVSIGGDTTNIATVANNSIINGYSFSFGGAIINLAITKYIEETYNIKISLDQAERIKIEYCSLLENYSDSIEISGFNKKEQKTEKITFSSSELHHILKHYYEKIADAIVSVIKSCEPEVVADIEKNGIDIYGGGSIIIGLDKFMTERTNFKINVSDTPKANILGLGELIKYPQILKRVIKNN